MAIMDGSEWVSMNRQPNTDAGDIKRVSGGKRRIYITPVTILKRGHARKKVLFGEKNAEKKVPEVPGWRGSHGSIQGCEKKAVLRPEYARWKR